MQRRRFTREELYDLVWSRPISRLAAELGISDVGLSKICDRNQIPTPPRGYWARHEAGKRVRRLPLPVSPDQSAAHIEVYGAMSRLPAEAREIASKLREEKPTNRPAAFTAPDTPPRNLHPIVQATARTLRTGKPGDDGLIHAVGDGYCGVSVGKAGVERVICFLDTLVRYLCEEGLQADALGRAVRVALAKDDLEFTLVERTKRTKHIPTPEETAAEQRRLKRRRQYWDSPRLADDLDFNFRGPAYPEFDVICTGELVCQVQGFSEGIRRSWGDGKTQTLESMIDDIVAGFKILLAARKVQREKREERQRLQDELQRRHELARGRKERDKQRVEFLQLMLGRQAEASRLRAFMASMPADAMTEDLERFMHWVQARLTETEEKLSPDALTAEIKAKSLFPGVDPFDAPLGEPPPLYSLW